MVKGAAELRKGVREAEAVTQVLLESAEVDKKAEKTKMSHFQAMALMGKLFFGLRMKENGGRPEESDLEEGDEEEAYEDDEDEDDHDEEASETESASGESGGEQATKTQVQVVIEKEDSSRERSPEAKCSSPVKTITHFQAVTLLTHLFAKVRAQHHELIKSRGGAAAKTAARSSSSEWTEPLTASDPSTETGATSSSSRYILL